VLGTVFLPLSLAFSISQGIIIKFPINPVFALLAVIVLTVEGVLVWRISFRNGKKAIV